MNDDDEELWYDDNLMFRLDQQKEKELVAAYSKAGNPVSQPSVIKTKSWLWISLQYLSFVINIIPMHVHTEKI